LSSQVERLLIDLNHNLQVAIHLVMPNSSYFNEYAYGFGNSEFRLFYSTHNISNQSLLLEGFSNLITNNSYKSQFLFNFLAIKLVWGLLQSEKKKKITKF